MADNRFGFGQSLGQDALMGLGVGLNALTGAGNNLQDLEVNQLLGNLNQQEQGSQLSSQQFGRLSQLAPDKADQFEGLVNARGEEGKKRTAAIAQDMLSVNRFLSAGRPEKAKELLDNRIATLAAQGRDITDTREIRDLIAEGDLEEAHELVSFGLQAFSDRGIIPGEQFLKIVGNRLPRIWVRLQKWPRQ